MADYQRLIESHGALEAVALATSAVRDAENAEEFADAMRSRFGIEPRTISGDEEATLTFLGATSELGNGEPTMVLDIGGGSTEFVVGTPGGAPDFHVSTRAGSVRQTERHLRDDPPPEDQVAASLRHIIACAEAFRHVGAVGPIYPDFDVDSRFVPRLVRLRQRVSHHALVQGRGEGLKYSSPGKE